MPGTTSAGSPAADRRPQVGSGSRGLARNLAGPELAEAFLLAAVVAVLAIRGFLAATGHPQVGGSTLHIAHMLWGGLGMLAALLMLLLFVGSRVLSPPPGSVGSGLGSSSTSSASSSPGITTTSSGPPWH